MSTVLHATFTRTMRWDTSTRSECILSRIVWPAQMMRMHFSFLFFFSLFCFFSVHSTRARGHSFSLIAPHCLQHCPTGWTDVSLSLAWHSTRQRDKSTERKISAVFQQLPSLSTSDSSYMCTVTPSHSSTVSSSNRYTRRWDGLFTLPLPVKHIFISLNRSRRRTRSLVSLHLVLFYG